MFYVAWHKERYVGFYTFHFAIRTAQRGVLIKQKPGYRYQMWKLSTLCDFRWHAHDCSAPENADDTLNKRWLPSTITVCYECVIKVHLLLWFTVWAGNTEMTTHTGIRMSPCGLSQSQRHTYHHLTHKNDKHVCLFSYSWLKIMNPFSFSLQLQFFPTDFVIQSVFST